MSASDRGASEVFESLLGVHDENGNFAPRTVRLSADESALMVQLQVNPTRFLPSIFEGDWANVNRHPDPGEIKLLRIVRGTDGVKRLIGRQGARLFAYPWLE